MTAQSLVRYNKQHSEDLRARTLATLEQEMSDPDTRITVSSIAKAVPVSREFIYSHPDLHKAIKDAATQRRTLLSEPRALTSDDTVLGLRSDVSVLTASIRQQKELIEAQRQEIAGLKEQRSKAFGDRLAALGTVTPESHLELRTNHDLLLSESHSMTVRIEAQDRRIAELEEQLLAAREAAQEVIRQANGGTLPSNVRGLHRPS